MVDVEGPGLYEIRGLSAGLSLDNLSALSSKAPNAAIRLEGHIAPA